MPSIERTLRWRKDPKNQLYCRCFCHWVEGKRDPDKLKTPSRRVLVPFQIDRTATSVTISDPDVRYTMCESCEESASQNPDVNNPKSCANARAYYEPIRRDDPEFTNEATIIYGVPGQSE
jgi:hypothetical protein